MKKLLAVALGLVCAVALTANAQDSKDSKKKMTEEQKTLRKSMMEKYDTNKDGKLDKAEKAKMSTEDKASWDKAFPPHKKKDGSKSDSSK